MPQLSFRRARQSRGRRGRRLGMAAVGVAALTVPLALVPTASAATSPVVRYSDRSVVAGTKVTATVKASTRPKGTTLVLERKHLDRWRTADPTATKTTKGYVLSVPTDQFGSFTYRVVAKDGSSVVARSSNQTVKVRPPYTPVGKPGQHLFSASPRVRWDSCRAIRWKFNATHAPRRALAQVKQGFRRIHLATGLDFTYAGKTKQKPNPHGTGLKGAEVIIGWRPASDYKPFRQNANTVGIGGNSFYYGYREADGTEVSKAVKGGVVLNATLKPRMKNGFGRGYTWGEVIIHELGHVVGLAHPNSNRQIMYYSVIRRNADWGAGDLAGFRRLGDTRGCLKQGGGRATGSVPERQVYSEF